ncbi:MAG: FAD-dependent oxidoreductase [Pseudomonadota bacterium]
MNDAQSDLVVIGGGLAGLTAAVRSAQLGLRVIVLEAGNAKRYLCNSRLAMGFFNVAFRDIREGATVMRLGIEQATLGTADPQLADTLAHNIGPALRWLHGCGIRTIVGNWRQGMAEMLVPPAAIGAGLRWPGRGADQMMRRLETLLLHYGGRLVRGARARELRMSDGRCVGLIADVQGRGVVFQADAVLIADGGFQNSETLLREFVTSRPDRMLMRNAGTARGDGLLMARRAGARIVESADFYGHVQSADSLHDPRLWPYPTLDNLIGAGVLVGADGARLTDEGMGGVFVANAIARQADPLGCVVIFDRTIWNGRAADFPLPANPLLAKAGAKVHRAASLDTLAASAGLPVPALMRTIADYNDAVRSHAADNLSPPRSGHILRPMPIADAPFFAVPAAAGITYTMGGIAIDGDARVRHRDGGFIAGLYAAGSTTGGHEGGPRVGYTGGLSKALTFGWCAARAVARDREAVVRLQTVQNLKPCVRQSTRTGNVDDGCER